MRQIRMLRARRRELETGLRTLYTGRKGETPIRPGRCLRITAPAPDPIGVSKTGVDRWVVRQALADAVPPTRTYQPRAEPTLDQMQAFGLIYHHQSISGFDDDCGSRRCRPAEAVSDGQANSVGRSCREHVCLVGRRTRSVTRPVAVVEGIGRHSRRQGSPRAAGIEEHGRHRLSILGRERGYRYRGGRDDGHADRRRARPSQAVGYREANDIDASRPEGVRLVW